jgi:hypothetical protein
MRLSRNEGDEAGDDRVRFSSSRTSHCNHDGAMFC